MGEIKNKTKISPLKKSSKQWEKEKTKQNKKRIKNIRKTNLQDGK